MLFVLYQSIILGYYFLLRSYRIIVDIFYVKFQNRAIIDKSLLHILWVRFLILRGRILRRRHTAAAARRPPHTESRVPPSQTQIGLANSPCDDQKVPDERAYLLRVESTYRVTVYMAIEMPAILLYGLRDLTFGGYYSPRGGQGGW